MYGDGKLTCSAARDWRAEYLFVDLLFEELVRGMWVLGVFRFALLSSCH